VIFLLIVNPSADKLRAKSGKTVVGVRLQGHTTFAEARLCALGQFLRPQVFSQVFLFFKGAQESSAVFLICSARPVRQRSLSADLTFLVLLCQDKRTKPSRGYERDDVLSMTTFICEANGVATLCKLCNFNPLKTHYHGKTRSNTPQHGHRC
jgi:hypothetical protein